MRNTPNLTMALGQICQRNIQSSNAYDIRSIDSNINGIINCPANPKLAGPSLSHSVPKILFLFTPITNKLKTEMEERSEALVIRSKFLLTAFIVSKN